VSQLLHEGPSLRGVDDLGHVLACHVEDVDVVAFVAEGDDLLGEGLLLFGELEVHDAILSPRRPPRIRRARSSPTRHPPLESDI